MNKLIELPRVKSKILTERIGLNIRSDVKERLYEMRDSGIDYQEWIRILIDRGLEEIETVSDRHSRLEEISRSFTND